MITWRSSCPPIVKIIRSSPNWRWLIFPNYPSGSPNKTLKRSVCMNIALKVSAARAKSRGDKGSPCQSPHFQRTKPCKDPLIRTLPFVELRIIWIQAIKWGPNPLATKISKRKFQSMESKSFAKLTLRARPSSLPFWRIKIVPWAAMMLSAIHPHLMKAN